MRCLSRPLLPRGHHGQCGSRPFESSTRRKHRLPLSRRPPIPQLQVVFLLPSPIACRVARRYSSGYLVPKAFLTLVANLHANTCRSEASADDVDVSSGEERCPFPFASAQYLRASLQLIVFAAWRCFRRRTTNAAETNRNKIKCNSIVE